MNEITGAVPNDPAAPITLVIKETSTLTPGAGPGVQARIGETLRLGRAGADRAVVEHTDLRVLTTGVQEGWAEAETDPTRIDWTARQQRALIPFAVVDGRPVRPGLEMSVHRGRHGLGRWGENVMADAIVTCVHAGRRYLLLIERGDGHGWAVPGGKVEAGEMAGPAAARELQEETGLQIPVGAWQPGTPRQVPDPRGSDEAWAVTVAAHADLGPLQQLPAVQGADDAARASWVPADTYQALTDHLAQQYGAGVFAAHTGLLREALTQAAR